MSQSIDWPPATVVVLAGRPRQGQVHRFLAFVGNPTVNVDKTFRVQPLQLSTGNLQQSTPRSPTTISREPRTAATLGQKVCLPKSCRIVQHCCPVCSAVVSLAVHRIPYANSPKAENGATDRSCSQGSPKPTPLTYLVGPVRAAQRDAICCQSSCTRSLLEGVGERCVRPN